MILIKISLKLFQMVFNQLFSIGSDNGLVPYRRQAIIWSNDGLIRLRIYTSLDLSELTIDVQQSFESWRTCNEWRTLRHIYDD